MIVTKRTHGYRSNRKYIQGKGFVDSLTSSLKSIGSYISQNKDLIAKPILGAVGNLAATGLEEGSKALLKHIINRNSQNKGNQSILTADKITTSPQLDQKSQQILQNIIGKSHSTSSIPVANIIGSGIKKF